MTHDFAQASRTMDGSLSLFFIYGPTRLKSTEVKRSFAGLQQNTLARFASLSLPMDKVHFNLDEAIIKGGGDEVGWGDQAVGLYPSL